MRQFKVTERFTPRGSRVTGNYYVDVERIPTITPTEEVDLAKRIQMGDTSARDKLVISNLRFVITVAKMYTKDPDEFNDIISAGNMGLIEAAEKFDPSRGFKFISFAVWYIRKEMIKHMCDNSRTIRVPQHRSQELRAIMDGATALVSKLGREVTTEEILEYLHDEVKDTRVKTKDPRIIQETMTADKAPSSLDMKFDGRYDSDATLHDVIPSSEPSTDHDAIKDSAIRMIETLSSTLSPIAREVVRRKHGLQDEDSNFIGEESYGSIGESMGLSPERVRQIYMKSLKVMRVRAKKLQVSSHDIIP